MVRKGRILREWWLRFWFEPVKPLNLGLCRILFFGAFFLMYTVYWRADFSPWAEVSKSFWMPIYLFEILHLPVLPVSLLIIIQSVWKLSLATSCLGLFTRTSTVSSFVLGIYLLGLPHNFGKINHGDALVVIVLGIMAVSRCGDAYSIDRLIWRVRQRGGSSVEQPRASGEYTWPVRAVLVMFALIFFAAGVSKLRHSGLEWIFSDNMANLLIRASYTHDELISLGPYVAQYSWLPQLIAAGTIALEISYPLALFSRRARWIIVPGVFFMQVGILVFMGVAFYAFLICNLFWIPWDRVSRRLLPTYHKRWPLHKHPVPLNGEQSKQDNVSR
jgi:hypothetical protein